MERKRVFISPEPMTYKFGYSGEDWSYGREKDHMESMAKELRDYLHTLDIDAVIGRTDYTDDELRAVVKAETIAHAAAYKRSDESDNWKADYHVCLHSNGWDKTKRGPVVYYSNDCKKSEALSKSILNPLTVIYDRDNIGVTKQAGLQTDTFIELGEPKAIGAYVEVAFHDNKADAQWIVRNLVKIAHAIGDGIYDYIHGHVQVTSPNIIKKGIYISPDNFMKFSVEKSLTNNTERQRMEMISREVYNNLKRVYKNVMLGDLAVGSGDSGVDKRIRESNAGGYGLHVCIHSRSYNGIKFGPEVFIASGDSFTRDIAQEILDNLFKLYSRTFWSVPKTEPVKKNKVIVLKNHRELDNTNAIAILVKVASQDNMFDKQWMYSKKNEIAQMIGDAIMSQFVLKGKIRGESIYTHRLEWSDRGQVFDIVPI
ncbi:MAG: N-acetylmuramoyl-L-alanine amidase [Oscillospiraceae bacterium]|nr:N-acetylmuramoyl-L-alanine amidase [Oscillospiraceae bacterium]